MVPADDHPGAALGRSPRYELLRQLAVGGMGEVFVAQQRAHGPIARHVALKLLLPRHACDPDIVSYFRHEQQLGVLLSHRNIATTLDAGKTGGRLYIAMPLLRGRSLVELLAAALHGGQPISVGLAVHLTIRLARAIAHLHDCRGLDGDPLGAIHMDLAPHNIIVEPGGEPVLIDFGISRSRLLPRVRLDLRGRTPYLAPELIRGEAADQRVDIFALGVILHEMLLARPLFRAPIAQQTATRILHAAIPPPHDSRSGCPKALGAIVLRALERDRHRRYVGADELADDLERCSVQHGLFMPQHLLAAELLRLERIGGDLGRAQAEPTVPCAPADAESTGGID